MKPGIPSKLDRHPELCHGDKDALRVSGTGAMRKREPTNPHTASKNVNMVWDYSQQAKVLPDGNPKSIIEATQATGSNRNYRTMNRSGKPYALGVQVGGSPDDRGNMYDRSPPAKIIKG